MIDEPTNPQQVIDDATKNMGSTPPPSIPTEETAPLPPPPTPQPEQIVIPPKEDTKQPPSGNTPKKQKSGKKIGVIIGIIIFLVLTLPVALYYGTQQNKQITESRSRASCPSGQFFCSCNADGCCLNKCMTVPAGQTCTNVIADSCGGGGNTGSREPEGSWHNCDYLHNTGSTGPAASSCDNTNCGGQPCGPFTFKCGVYCLRNSCGADACHDDVAAPTATPTIGVTNTPVPTATETPANTNAPGRCDASCDADANCESGFSCQTVSGIKRCRKAECPTQVNCECPVATAAPTSRPFVIQPTREQVVAQVAEPTREPTPKVPVSGIFDSKAILVTVGSILLLAVGLAL